MRRKGRRNAPATRTLIGTLTLFFLLEHGAGAVLRTAAAGPELLERRGVALGEGDAVVVAEFFARLDRAHALDPDLVLLLVAAFILVEHRFAVRVAAVVDPARRIRIEVGVDDPLVVQGEEEGVAVVVFVAIGAID